MNIESASGGELETRIMKGPKGKGVFMSD